MVDRPPRSLSRVAATQSTMDPDGGVGGGLVPYMVGLIAAVESEFCSISGELDFDPFH